jgi:hypothetical protein
MAGLRWMFLGFGFFVALGYVAESGNFWEGNKVKNYGAVGQRTAEIDKTLCSTNIV